MGRTGWESPLAGIKIGAREKSILGYNITVVFPSRAGSNGCQMYKEGAILQLRDGKILGYI